MNAKDQKIKVNLTHLYIDFTLSLSLSHSRQSTMLLIMINELFVISLDCFFVLFSCVIFFLLLSKLNLLPFFCINVELLLYHRLLRFEVNIFDTFFCCCQKKSLYFFFFSINFLSVPKTNSTKTINVFLICNNIFFFFFRRSSLKIK